MNRNVDSIEVSFVREHRRKRENAEQSSGFASRRNFVPAPRRQRTHQRGGRQRSSFPIEKDRRFVPRENRPWHFPLTSSMNRNSIHIEKNPKTKLLEDQ